MIGFLLAPENIAFSTALMLMLLIGLVEALGFGMSAFDGGAELEAEVGHPLLDWLGFRRLPLLMTLVVFLAVFALVGLASQQVALAWSGAVLPAWVAGLVAAGSAVPLTGLLSRPLARFLPQDETTAVILASLVGRRGHVVLGTAAGGSPARARVRDHYGQSHYVLVEPNLPGERLAEGDEILLVAREAGHFRAIAVAPHFSLEEGAAA